MATLRELEIVEKIGALSAKVGAAHSRLDKLEVDIKDALKELHEDLKTLNAHMNKGKGWNAALMFLAAIFGAIIAELVKK